MRYITNFIFLMISGTVPVIKAELLYFTIEG